MHGAKEISSPNCSDEMGAESKGPFQAFWWDSPEWKKVLEELRVGSRGNGESEHLQTGDSLLPISKVALAPCRQTQKVTECVR